VAAIYGLELHVNGDLLAITHAAKNSFVIVTLAKLTKSDGGIEVEMVQATSDNYSSVDVFLSEDTKNFISDQDIVNDVSSPWGTHGITIYKSSLELLPNPARTYFVSSRNGTYMIPSTKWVSKIKRLRVTSNNFHTKMKR